MMGIRGRANYKLDAYQTPGQLTGAHKPVCLCHFSSRARPWVQDPRRPIEAGEGGARGAEEVEKSLFQANQPWAELGEQGRKRKGVARSGDHGGINGKGLMVRPIFPPYQKGLQWHY